MQKDETSAKKVAVKELVTELNQSLFATLGYYDLKESTYIYLPGTNGLTLGGATATHEAVHARMFGGTTFGFFQKMVANLLDQPFLNDLHSLILKKLLNTSIESSLSAHEGIATYIQFLYVQELYGNDLEKALAWLNSKPELYRVNALKYKLIVERLRVEGIPSRPVALAVAEAIFQTNILDCCPTSIVDTPPLYLSEIKRENPNARLDCLYNLISIDSKAKSISADINQRITAFNYSARGPESTDWLDVFLSVFCALNNSAFAVQAANDQEKIAALMKNASDKTGKGLLKLGYNVKVNFNRVDSDYYETLSQFKASENSPKEYVLLSPSTDQNAIMAIKEMLRNGLPKKYFWLIHILSPATPNFPKHCSSEFSFVINTGYEQGLAAREVVISGPTSQIIEILGIASKNDNVVFVAPEHIRTSLEMTEVLKQINHKRLYLYLAKSSLKSFETLRNQNVKFKHWSVMIRLLQSADLYFIFYITDTPNLILFSPVAPQVLLKVSDWGQSQASKEFTQQLAREADKVVGHFARFGY